MKISKIEFENFRNFKEKYRLDFPTDGSEGQGDHDHCI